MIATGAGGLQIPLSVLLAAGGGLISAIVYVFHLLIASQERRAGELIAQMKEDRKAAEQKSIEYASRLEAMIAANEVTQKEMITTVALNAEAFRANTAAREASNLQISQFVPEIASAVMLKLVEFGILTSPLKGQPPSSLGAVGQKP